MKIKFIKKERNLIVEIYGELDHHTSVEIRERIEKEFDRAGCKNIIFNFKSVNFMDSSGVGMVIGRYKYIKGSGGDVAIAGVNENIDRIFSISGLYKIIKSYAKIEDALHSM